jgi:hypothetical protein
MRHRRHWHPHRHGHPHLARHWPHFHPHYRPLYAPPPVRLLHHEPVRKGRVVRSAGWSEGGIDHAKARMLHLAARLDHAATGAQAHGHPVHARSLAQMATAARAEHARLAKLDRLDGLGELGAWPRGAIFGLPYTLVAAGMLAGWFLYIANKRR